MPHEMQDQLHSSLLLTPRPPIEGEPNGCKQEVVDSVVTAGRIKGMVKMAKPTEIVDVDRTALLGGKPAERACGVDEGDSMECKDLCIPKAEFYCEEKDQCNGNATGDIPSARKLPLVGEWTVCASGKVSNLEVKPADSPIESKTLVVVLIELEDLRSSRIPRVHLGGTSCCVGDANCPGNRVDALYCRMDMSKGLPDVSRGWTDTLDVSNRPVTAIVSHSDGARTYLAIGDARRIIHDADGVRSHADGIRSHADASTGQTDTPSVETNLTKPENEMEIVSMRRIDLRTRNSPYTAEIVMSKPTRRWKRVSIEGVDVYLPWDAPVEVLSRTFAFGQVKGADEAIAPIAEGETAEGAGNGGGDRDGYDGDGDGMASSSNADST